MLGDGRESRDKPMVMEDDSDDIGSVSAPVYNAIDAAPRMQQPRACEWDELNITQR